MGLQISELVPKKEISWEFLKNKKIAVDASQMLYQFLSSIRQRDGSYLTDSKGFVTSHLIGLSTRIPNLMKRGLKLAFVFDGRVPKLKFKEQEERSLRKDIAEKKLEEARKKKDIELIQRYAKQTSRLNQEMIDEAKDLLKAFGLPVIQAPSEAEAQCSFMCEQGDVYAVATSDFDCLIYGAPRMVRNLTLASKRRLPSGAYINITPELIELKDVLNNLNIDRDKLIILATLTGTDYNPKGVKGIGPKTALRLVKEYHDYNTLFKEVKAEFNWKEVYAVIKSMPIMKNYQLKWDDVNRSKVRQILVKKHDFNEERVDKILSGFRKKDDGLKKWF